jgi:hypothetical protein
MAYRHQEALTVFIGRATISWMFGSIGPVGVGIANGEYYNNTRIK